MTPEKKVESLVLAKCFELNMCVNVFDSKATYSVASRGYKSGTHLPVGTPDLFGNDENGYLVAIELKAIGKEKVCSLEQYRFLHKKITRNAFAIVTSCPLFLEETYKAWLLMSQSDRRTYLFTLLPKKVYLKQGKKKVVVPAPQL